MSKLAKLREELDHAETELVWELQHGETVAGLANAETSVMKLRETIAEIEGNPLHRVGYAQRLTRL